MEGGPFLSREMQNEFGRFVMIELHTDGRASNVVESSQRNRTIQRERFKTIALPYYALMDSTGKKIYWEASGKVSHDDFLAALRAVPDSE